jgi:hypothetical protein
VVEALHQRRQRGQKDNEGSNELEGAARHWFEDRRPNTAYANLPGRHSERCGHSLR